MLGQFIQSICAEKDTTDSMRIKQDSRTAGQRWEANSVGQEQKVRYGSM